ncbi:MAG: hypothetical protein L0Y56_01700, partial [Nitrospira sp.]|nr:hypothetical protein [Nitrospira sp.]
EIANIDKETAVSLKKDLLEVQKLEKEIKQMDEVSPEVQARIDEIKARTAQTLAETGQIVAGEKVSKATLLGFAARRAAGELSEDMPLSIQKMTPEVAQKFIETQTRPLIQVGPQGALETKGARDRARAQVDDISVTQDLITQAIDALERSPEAGGLVGTLARGGQRVVGAATDVFRLVKGTGGIEKSARQQIARDLAKVPGDLRAEVGSTLSNPDVSLAEILEVQIALRAALSSGATGSRQLRAQYEDLRAQAQITGLIGVDKVKDRLRFLRDNVLELQKETITNRLLGGEEEGAEGAESDELRKFLEDNNLLGEEEEEEE